MKKIFFSFSVVFFVTMLSISCKEDGLSGKYLFNDDLVSTSKSPSAQTDFHTYSFDPDSGNPHEIRNFNVDHCLEMIFGSRAFLTGTVKGGHGTDLKGIYSIPLIKKDFGLLKFYETGRIIFECKNHGDPLNFGEGWTSDKTCVDTNVHGRFVSISKITDSEKIINLGYIENEKVKNWEVVTKSPEKRIIG